MKKAVIIILCIVSGICSYAEREGELPIPETIRVKEDSEWIEIFSEKLTAMLSGANVHKRSLSLVCKILDDEDFPVEPGEAALMVFGAVKRIDVELKRGKAMAVVKAKIKQDWNLKMKSGFKVNILKEKNTKIRLKDDSEVEKVKPAEIKIVKEKKDKEEKEEKEKKEKKEKEKEELY